MGVGGGGKVERGRAGAGREGEGAWGQPEGGGQVLTGVWWTSERPRGSNLHHSDAITPSPSPPLSYRPMYAGYVYMSVHTP